MMEIPKDVPLVLVATPAYGGMLHMDYVTSMIELTQAQIGFVLYGLGNESLIPRGRNIMLSHFVNNPQYTHLIFIDADMYLSGEGFKKLFHSGKDVIGAMVRLKTQDKLFNVHGFHPERKEGADLIPIDHLGTAVMMVSRKAVLDVAHYLEKKEDAINVAVEELAKIDAPWAKDTIKEIKGRGYIYDRKSFALQGNANSDGTQYDFCGVGVHDGVYLSEDYVFCKYLRECGYDIWLDTSIVTRHNGMLSLDNNETHFGDK